MCKGRTTMLRAMLQGLAIFILGPVLAMGVLAIGCEGGSPALGNACGHNALHSLAFLTLAFWFVLVMARSVWSAMRNDL